MRVRVPGSKEERWLVVLDEAHGWLNARNWNAGDRDRIIKWLSQHRKLGAKVLLISQDAENIDAQVRRLVEVEIRLRNLKNARVAGIPISLGRNLMLAIWSWAGGQKMILRRQVMRLDWRRKLYNTHQLPLTLDDADADAIWLPSKDLPADAAGGARATAAAAAAASVRDQDGPVVAGIRVGRPLIDVPGVQLAPELATGDRASDRTQPNTPAVPAAEATAAAIAPPDAPHPATAPAPSMPAVRPRDGSGCTAVQSGPSTTEAAALTPRRLPGDRGDGSARPTSRRE
jgi:Zonular occludens toxin (Zot)